MSYFFCVFIVLISVKRAFAFVNNVRWAWSATCRSMKNKKKNVSDTATCLARVSRLHKTGRIQLKWTPAVQNCKYMWINDFDIINLESEIILLREWFVPNRTQVDWKQINVSTFNDTQVIKTSLKQCTHCTHCTVLLTFRTTDVRKSMYFGPRRTQEFSLYLTYLIKSLGTERIIMQYSLTWKNPCWCL